MDDNTLTSKNYSERLNISEQNIIRLQTSLKNVFNEPHLVAQALIYFENDKTRIGDLCNLVFTYATYDDKYANEDYLCLGEDEYYLILSCLSNRAERLHTTLTEKTFKEEFTKHRKGLK